MLAGRLIRIFLTACPNVFCARIEDMEASAPALRAGKAPQTEQRSKLPVRT
jgi:hypothetical protein